MNIGLEELKIVRLGKEGEFQSFEVMESKVLANELMVLFQFDRVWRVGKRVLNAKQALGGIIV